MEDTDRPIVWRQAAWQCRLIPIASRAITVTMLALFLAGCGVTTAPSPLGGETTTSPSSAGTTTTKTTPSSTATNSGSQVAGSAALNGCRVQQAPATAGARGDVIVRGGSGETITGQTTPPVGLRQGQTLEVQLSAASRWGLSQQDPNHILTPATVNDWYDASLHACIWRFTATAQGNASLDYAGSPVCAPRTMCPTLVVLDEIAVTVHA